MLLFRIHRSPSPVEHAGEFPALAFHAGTLELSIPYSHPLELLMDLQRHGSDAEVISPPELRAEMKRILAGAVARYGEKGEAG